MACQNARVGAVVLASGEGSRFGGNKLLAPFGGAPLIARTLAALPEGLFARRLVVTRSADIAELARTRGFEALVHELPRLRDTIRLGASAMDGMDGCLFCVGDQPFISERTVRALIAAFAGGAESICRASFDGRAGNPVIFPAALFQELCSLGEEQSGGAVIARHAELVRLVEVASPLELADIDTADDYQRLLKESGAGASDR